MTTFTKREQAAIDRALNIIREKAPTHGEGFTSPAITRAHLKLFFADKHDREHFVCVMLDNQNQLITTEVLFMGTIDGAAVYPREVVKAALRCNAAAVIFAHNHPSGVAEPSHADRRITERLQAALALLDIRVLDHIIVTQQGDTHSFAECGLL